MGQRRKARELAIQTLYALDFAEIQGEFREYSLLNEYPEIMLQLTDSEGIDPTSSVYAFANELVKNAIINIDDVEAEIVKHSDNWSLGDIAHLDRNVLHISVYELMFTDTPPAVIINEAIEIAKKFSSEASGKYINGILDAVNRELKTSSTTLR